ncbi:MAG: FAD-dependent oxidoreductase [Calditrichia bacterium]
MNTREYEVADFNDLKDGEMKNVKVNEQEILLTRIDGKIYALGAHCTHYGAPLNKGVLSGDRIVCPWHHACFNARSGELEEPPALDALPHFEVTRKDDKIFVTLPQQIPHSRTPKMARNDPGRDDRVFVVLGAGAAGNMAAQTLREDGFNGKIIMITRENRLPYDRPNLSKDYLQGEAEEEWMPLRDKSFFEIHDIELRLGATVSGVDSKSRTVTFEDGSSLEYDKILLATGGTPQKLDVPGNDLENIFYLRTFDNADSIITAAEKAKRALVVGSGFIGMETAFSLKKRGLQVTVVTKEEIPFQSKLGSSLGKVFQKEHEKNGITFFTKSGVKEFTGNGKVEAVILENGKRLEADMVLLGLGVEPVTDYLKSLPLEDDGSIKTNAYFRAAENLFAVGDIASFPLLEEGRLIRIEHWRTAEQHGRTAAHNMLGKDVKYTAVPFFWTNQFDLKLRYVGYASDWDEELVRGSLEKQDFIVFYLKDGKVLAAAGNNRNREMDAVSELMRLDKMPGRERLEDDSTDFVQLLKS